MPQAQAQIFLHPRNGVYEPEDRTLAALVAWFESPFSELSEDFTFTVLKSCNTCDVAEPVSRSIEVPGQLKEHRQTAVSPKRTADPGHGSLSGLALVDEHYRLALGPQAKRAMADLEVTLSHNAAQTLCFSSSGKECVTLSPLELWWWAISHAISGPSETYRRSHSLAEHRFIASPSGDGLIADLRVFLPTVSGAVLRASIAATPERVSVPQGLYPTVGRLLPEAQPYLLPVRYSVSDLESFDLEDKLMRGTPEKLGPTELRNVQREYRRLQKTGETLAMKVRAAINRLVGVLFGSPTIVRILRIPSQKFPRLSRSARAALTSGVTFRSKNSYLSDADSKKLASDEQLQPLELSPHDDGSDEKDSHELNSAEHDSQRTLSR